MNSANVEMLELAAAAFVDLPDEVVFVGGATVELWATEAAPEFSPTEDVAARPRCSTSNPRAPSPDRGTVRVHTRVLNQDGVLVAEFKRLVLVLRKK